MEKIFYNILMAKAIRKVKKPVKDLKVDVRARPNYLALTVYEDNVCNTKLIREQISWSIYYYVNS